MKNASVTAYNRLRRAILRLYDLNAKTGKRGGWRAVGASFGISGAIAYRIANSDYLPKSPDILRRLGLPVTAPAPVCRKCGNVHTAKRCTKRPTFEEYAAEYEAWKARNLNRLQSIVDWATLKKG